MKQHIEATAGAIKPRAAAPTPSSGHIAWLAITVLFLMGQSQAGWAQGLGELQVRATVVRAETSVEPRERAARLAMEPRPAGEHTLWSLQRELRREGPREAVRVTLNFLAN